MRGKVRIALLVSLTAAAVVVFGALLAPRSEAGGGKPAGDVPLVASFRGLVTDSPIADRIMGDGQGPYVHGVTAVLSAGGSPGTLADDPCGGHYVGHGLKASFSSSYSEGGVPYDSNILNDIPDYYYQYAVPGGNCVFYFRSGQVALGVDWTGNGRHVNMRFLGELETPTGTGCAPHPPYFVSDTSVDGFPTKEFFFRTSGGYTWSRNADGKLILKGTAVNLDLEAMTPGQTAYCDTWLNFHIMDDPGTAYDESADEFMCSGDPVKVTYGLVDGTLKWVIRPIAEPYTIRTETKVKAKIIVTDTSYSNALFRTIVSNALKRCLHGTFYFPFELTFERLK